MGGTSLSRQLKNSTVPLATHNGWADLSAKQFCSVLTHGLGRMWMEDHAEAEQPRAPKGGSMTTDNQQSNARLGFIGMDAMGSRMAGRLLAAGYNLTVYNLYNREWGHTSTLEQRGAKVA